ncbi:hypothetical protein DLE01_19415 [Streptomyces sp. FT05W]|nr:hypothetical protein DLE01_19415 [Streptomyces sp. FT05W]
MRGGEFRTSTNAPPGCGQVTHRQAGSLQFGGVESSPTGEEEVKATESAAPAITGVWCKREMLRR